MTTISRVLDQNGVSQACYIVQIHHSGQEALIWWERYTWLLQKRWLLYIWRYVHMASSADDYHIFGRYTHNYIKRDDFLALFQQRKPACISSVCPSKQIRTCKRLSLFPVFSVSSLAHDMRLMCCTWFAHDCARATWANVLETVAAQWGDCKKFQIALLNAIIIIIILTDHHPQDWFVWLCSLESWLIFYCCVSLAFNLLFKIVKVSPCLLMTDDWTVQDYMYIFLNVNVCSIFTWEQKL